MDLQEAATELLWWEVPQRAVALAEKCADVASKSRKSTFMEDQDGFLDLWYNVDLDKLILNVGDWVDSDNLASWKAKLSPLAAHFEVADEAGGPGPGNWDKIAGWVKIAERPPEARAFLEKQSVSPTLSALATATGYKPNPILHGSTGNPNPLTSLLASGLLGTGAGYGLGFMAEQLMPDQWERGKLRRAGAIAGGLLGAAPPLAWMAANVHGGQHWNQGHPGPAVSGMQSLTPALSKAGSQSGYDGPWPSIDVPGFTSALWDDHRVRDAVPVQTRAAATGLVAGASALRDGDKWVTPRDIARITAGMGVGYLSGGLVGKVLGILTGMPEQTQERLKNTGMYAGIINAIVPMAF